MATLLVVSVTVSACASTSDNDLEVNDNALTPAECQGTADTGFCTRNAEYGDQEVSMCWDEAERPWKAYLEELKAARDTHQHPEIATCAAAEKEKSESELRKDCHERGDSPVCDAAPALILRLWAELRCTTKSPAYKELNDEWMTHEAAYLKAGARCVGMWMKNKLWQAGCVLVEKALYDEEKGTASADCLAKCPEPGVGGVCVPARYRRNNDPVPCGIIAEVNGMCTCSEDTAVCDRYRDAVENFRGFAVCPPGQYARPSVVAEPGKPARMVTECVGARSRN